MKDRWKIILAGGLFALSAAAVAVCVVYICGGDAPKITAVFFFVSCALCLGCLLALTGFIIEAIKNKSKNKKLQNAGLLQIPSQDVIRKPVEYDVEQGFKELEQHMLKFFDNIVYPQGFTEFLKKHGKSHRMADGGETIEKEEKVFTTLYVERDGEYFGIDNVYPQGEIIEINKDILIYNDDYYTQFRDILLFADDESGHCHFLLDYGKGGEPKVKYLDDETDVVRTLAESFAEFTQKLKECTYDEYYKLLSEYDKNNLKR